MGRRIQGRTAAKIVQFDKKSVFGHVFSPPVYSCTAILSVFQRFPVFCLGKFRTAVLKLRKNVSKLYKIFNLDIFGKQLEDACAYSIIYANVYAFSTLRITGRLRFFPHISNLRKHLPQLISGRYPELSIYIGRMLFQGIGADIQHLSNIEIGDIRKDHFRNLNFPLRQMLFFQIR